MTHTGETAADSLTPSLPRALALALAPAGSRSRARRLARCRCSKRHQKKFSNTENFAAARDVNAQHQNRCKKMAWRRATEFDERAKTMLQIENCQQSGKFDQKKKYEHARARDRRLQTATTKS